MVPKRNGRTAFKFVIQLQMALIAVVAHQEISVPTGDSVLALAIVTCIEEPAQIKPGIETYALQIV